MWDHLAIFFFWILSLLRTHAVLSRSIAWYAVIAITAARLLKKHSRRYSSSEVDSLNKEQLTNAIDALETYGIECGAVLLVGLAAELVSGVIPTDTVFLVEAQVLVVLGVYGEWISHRRLAAARFPNPLPCPKAHLLRRNKADAQDDRERVPGLASTLRSSPATALTSVPLRPAMRRRARPEMGSCPFWPLITSPALPAFWN
jgi:hypothetical protein